MSEQDNGQLSTIQRPTTNDPDAWKAYWEAQDQPWRTEPEIVAERQKYLTERRAVVSDIEKGIYPFGEITLNRADVEWLLATHENGLGPVDPSKRYIFGHARGLDLRGATLCNVNLSGMPLIQLRAGLRNVEWHRATVEQREKAATHLEGASLYRADLRWSTLRSTHLEGADLRLANLEGSTFRGAHLEGADLRLTFFDHKTVFHGATLAVLC